MNRLPHPDDGDWGRRHDRLEVLPGGVLGFGVSSPFVALEQCHVIEAEMEALASMERHAAMAVALMEAAASRRRYPASLANALVQVQPMRGPTAITCYHYRALEGLGDE